MEQELGRTNSKESALKALHWCIDYNYGDIIDALLQTHFSHAKISDLEPDCDAVLTCTVKGGKKEIFLKLLPYIDDSFFVGRKGSDVVTKLLCLAVTRGFTDLAIILIRKGAQVNGYSNGTPLLHAALGQGSMPLVRKMISSGADVHSLDDHGESVYFAAMKAENCAKSGVLALLIRHKADWSIPNYAGKYLIHVAAQKSSNLTAQLAMAGSDVNIKDKVHGNTPLHYACAAVCSDSIFVLIQHGASLNAVNNETETPLVKLLKHATLIQDSRSASRFNLAGSLVRAGCNLGSSSELGAAYRRKVTCVYRSFVKDAGVPSLQSLSRLVVNERLGGVDYRKKVMGLTIPRCMRPYLCHDDIGQ